jgi:hypothetical protein
VGRIGMAMGTISEGDTNNGLVAQEIAITQEPSIEVLRTAVEEQRRFHDELTSSFRSLRTKILSFIGAILALLAFLYASAADAGKNVPTADRLFIPDELYGLIFYFVGLACLLYALARLVHGAKPDVQWNVPFEHKDYLELKESDERLYLEKLKNEYVSCGQMNITVHEKKSEAIADSFYPLLIGAILLVVLRYFQ